MGAASVLGVVVIAGASGGSDTGAAAPGSTLPAAVVTTPESTMPVVTQPNIVVPTSVSSVQKSPIAGPVSVGAYGDDVKKIQQRLTELGFAPGPADGAFGGGTQQAVWAYKKFVLGVTWEELEQSDSASVVTPEMWDLMQDPIVIQPRRNVGGGTHVEIYLPLQVMAVFTDGKPTLIAHISSGELDENGKPALWCEVTKYDTDNEGRPLDEPVIKDECAYSKTPGGVFRFRRKVDGNRVGPLGGMYNPVYFNYGIAVHGAKNVPRHPASHGCIRINNDIAEYFPDLVSIGNPVFVWGHDGREPEGYTKKEMLPSFNYPNPDSTLTTTTAPTTTVPKSTTTTTKPPATTTTKPPTTTTKPPVTTTTTTTVEPPDA
jgi:peptidoglycan hydrolase-like protein with peptidoglycan-binding domain